MWFYKPVNRGARFMDFKKSIENHPMTFLVTCIIAASSLTAGVQRYFSTQQTNLLNERHRSEIEELNSKLSSLRRGIPGNEFFDVRHLLYSPNNKTNTPPSSSAFFQEQFYGPKGGGDWIYKQTTELEVMSDLTGISLKSLPVQFQKANSVLTLHVWKAKDETSIEGHDAFKKLYPLITVEKVSFEQMRTISGIAAANEDDADQTPSPEVKQSAQKAVEEKNSDAQKFLDGMDKVFRGDAIGAFFRAQLDLQFAATLLSQKTSVNVVEIQKVGNVLYAQFLITLKDVKVGGRPVPEYFLRKELIIISTPEGAFVINTLVPSDDPAPRSQSFAAVSKWLDDFRVVIS